MLVSSCATQSGKPLSRKGDEIVVAGHFFHTGTPVVLWMDPGGYDAYRVERRFSPFDKSDWETSQEENKELHSPNRYDLRKGLTPEQIEQTRGGGWDLALLQDSVDQFVIHYDATGTSRHCFRVLHDVRDLSVHFLLDLDGTIYQTLDLKERARHAGQSNSRSIGIEIANIGAFEVGDDKALNEWYHHDSKGETTITIPPRFGTDTQRTPHFEAHPIRPELIRGDLQGKTWRQHDLTPQQYAALIKLTKTVCAVLPKIKCDYPRDENGKLITQALSEEELSKYQGLIGHFHIQTNKIDPGPAFQWDYLVSQARK